MEAVRSLDNTALAEVASVPDGRVDEAFHDDSADMVVDHERGVFRDDRRRKFEGVLQVVELFSPSLALAGEGEGGKIAVTVEKKAGSHKEHQKSRGGLVYKRKQKPYVVLRNF